MLPYEQFLGTSDPFEVMSSTPGKIADVKNPKQPPPGKWSLQEIVAHLADTELMFQVRIRLILFEDTPRLVAFDQDRWTSGWVREKETYEQTLERFRVLRESTVRLLRNTPEHDLLRTGVHDERGVQTAKDYITIIAGHDVNHLNQVAALAG